MYGNVDFTEIEILKKREFRSTELETARKQNVRGAFTKKVEGCSNFSVGSLNEIKKKMYFEEHCLNEENPCCDRCGERIILSSKTLCEKCDEQMDLEFRKIL